MPPADCTYLVQRRNITQFLIRTVCLSGNIRQKEDFIDCWYSNILACLLYVTYMRLGVYACVCVHVFFFSFFFQWAPPPLNPFHFFPSPFFQQNNFKIADCACVKRCSYQVIFLFLIDQVYGKPFYSSLCKLGILYII